MATKRKSDNATSETSVTITVTLSAEQGEYLRRLKEQQGVNSSWLLRQLLAKHMQPKFGEPKG